MATVYVPFTGERVDFDEVYFDTEKKVLTFSAEGGFVYAKITADDLAKALVAHAPDSVKRALEAK